MICGFLERDIPMVRLAPLDELRELIYLARMDQLSQRNQVKEIPNGLCF